MSKVTIKDQKGAAKSYREKYYRKDGKPRRVLKCRSCGKMAMTVARIDRTFISGNGHYYECSCGAKDSAIL